MALLYAALVVSAAASGYLGNQYAKRTEKNRALWTFYGVAFNVFMLAAILIFHKSNKVTAR